MKERQDCAKSKIGRREFINRISTGVLRAAVVSKLPRSIPPMHNLPAQYDVMKEVMKYRKIDSHCHVYLYHGGPRYANQVCG